MGAFVVDVGAQHDLIALTRSSLVSLQTITMHFFVVMSAAVLYTKNTVLKPSLNPRKPVLLLAV